MKRLNGFSQNTVAKIDKIGGLEVLHTRRCDLFLIVPYMFNHGGSALNISKD
jgi:hypothetical protein